MSPTALTKLAAQWQRHFHRGSHKPYVGLLLLTTISLHLVLRSSYQSGDSLAYLETIRAGGATLFHPHHLLFSPAIRLAYLFANAFFAGADIMLIGQLHNIAWACSSILCMYLLTYSIYGSKTQACLAAFALLSCRSVVSYTTQIEVYVPALGALSIMTLLLYRVLVETKPNSIRLVLVSLFYAIAVFYHQTNVLVFVPVSLVLYLKFRSIRGILLAILPAFIIVLGSYILVFVLYDLHLFYGQEESKGFDWRAFILFCVEYTQEPIPAWGTFAHYSPGGLLSLITSQVAAIVPLSFAIQLPPDVGARLPDSPGGMPHLFIWSIMISILLSRIEWKNPDTKLFFNFNLVWLAVHYLFFLWWLPNEIEFFIVSLFPLLTLLFIKLAPLKQLNRHVFSSKIWLYPTLVLIALSLFFVLKNTVYQHANKGPGHARAKELMSLHTGQELFMLSRYDVIGNLNYYFDRSGQIVIGIEAEDAPASPDLNTVLLLSQTYQHELDRDRYRFISRNPLIVDFEGLLPSLEVSGYSGETNPKEWFVFVSWVFDIEERDDWVEFRKYEITKTDSNHYYLRLSVEKRRAQSYVDFFAGIDSNIQASNKPREPSKETEYADRKLDDGVFETWYYRHFSEINLILQKPRARLKERGQRDDLQRGSGLDSSPKVKIPLLEAMETSCCPALS